ncbi:hypothetical protein Hanom_Chr09g00784121 [Helianthus anomalus]
MVCSRDKIGTIPVPIPKIQVPNLNKTGYQIPYQIYRYGTGTGTGISSTVPALVLFCFYLVFKHLYEY